jgi:hypothetical protein
MELKPIKNSSNILGAGYDNGVVEIHFKGRKEGDAPIPYRSSKPVTQEEWEAFESTFDDEANSTGSHFHNNLKAKIFKQIGDE